MLHAKIPRPLAPIFLSLFLLACGASMTKTARTAINTTAVAVTQTDKLLAPLYAQARVDARETSASWQERDAKMQHWDAVTDAVLATYKFLAAAEIGLNAWEIGDGDKDFLLAAACTAQSLDHLRQGLAELEINLPDAIDRALKLLASFGPAVCFE